MSIRRPVPALLVCVALAALVSPPAHAKQKMLIQPSDGFDASVPRTYAYTAILADDGTPRHALRPIDRTAMKEIDAGLGRLGWTRTDVASEADVLVTYGGHADPSSRDGYVWFVDYYDGTVSNYGGRTSVEGWLTLTVVDAATREELWRGTHLAAADATEENVRKAVVRTLRKLLKQLDR